MVFMYNVCGNHDQGTDILFTGTINSTVIWSTQKTTKSVLRCISIWFMLTPLGYPLPTLHPISGFSRVHIREVNMVYVFESLNTYLNIVMFKSNFHINFIYQEGWDILGFKKLW